MQPTLISNTKFLENYSVSAYANQINYLFYFPTPTHQAKDVTAPPSVSNHNLMKPHVFRGHGCASGTSGH